MNTIDKYRQMPIIKLQSLIKDFEMKLMQSHSKLDNPKSKKEHRKLFKKEIAKIQTVLRERELKK